MRSSKHIASLQKKPLQHGQSTRVQKTKQVCQQVQSSINWPQAGTGRQEAAAPRLLHVPLHCQVISNSLAPTNTQIEQCGAHVQLFDRGRVDFLDPLVQEQGMMGEVPLDTLVESTYETTSLARSGT
jgi:hypothetical protein